MDVGVIGVGAMGKNHVRVYSELKSVNSLGIYDVNTQAAKALGEKHGATVYDSISELLDNSDAVSVVVPTQFHSGVVGQVFAKKKSVLIEKPICATAEEARQLMKTAPEGITIGVGHIERFNPIVAEIKKIVKKPLYMEFKRHNPASARITGSSVVEDIPVSLSASRKASKKIRLFYVEDEEFTIEGNFMTQEVTIHRKPGQYHVEAERYVQENIIEKVMVNTVEPLKRELETFIDCVNKNQPFLISPEQAIRNLVFCEKVSSAM
jgi:predicted dehydrogenase